jgi:hypothetical protein
MYTHFTLISLLLAAGLFLGMLALIELGRRIGLAKLARDPEGLSKGIGASEGAIFGLLGLVIAFTFSGAAARFEGRRQLITEEVNNIGTAYLRIDVVPDAARQELRDLFRRYLDLRIATYANVENLSEVDNKMAETTALQNIIWTKAVEACRRPDIIGRPEAIFLPALNQMFDIVTTRKAATLNHPPPAIYALLGALSLVGSLLIGYGSSTNKYRPRLHAFVFAAITSLSILMIIDLEFPRLGFIRVDSSDQLMVDLRKSIE